MKYTKHLFTSYTLGPDPLWSRDWAWFTCRKAGGNTITASKSNVVQQAKLMDSAGTAWHAVKYGNLEVSQAKKALMLMPVVALDSTSTHAA